MPNQSPISTRKYTPNDREAVRKLSFETALLGESAAAFFGDEEILADALTLYFTDYESESCFVAAAEGKVIGYITGAKNIENMNKVITLKIIPKIIFKSFRKGILFNIKTLRFLIQIGISFLKGEFFSPGFLKQFPATFHINIDKNYRGSEIGTNLITVFLNYLQENNIQGVQCRTVSERAKKFFEKNGFTIVYQGKYSYLKKHIGEVLPYYVLGKEIISEQ